MKLSKRRWYYNIYTNGMAGYWHGTRKCLEAEAEDAKQYDWTRAYIVSARARS